MKKKFEEEGNEYAEQTRGYGASADMRDNNRSGRGQRGGYRGGYKDNRGDGGAARRGRGYRTMGPKNEFDGGEDDEDQVYAPPSRV